MVIEGIRELNTNTHTHKHSPYNAEKKKWATHYKILRNPRALFHLSILNAHCKSSCVFVLPNVLDKQL